MWMLLHADWAILPIGIPISIFGPKAQRGVGAIAFISTAPLGIGQKDELVLVSVPS